MPKSKKTKRLAPKADMSLHRLFHALPKTNANIVEAYLKPEVTELLFEKFSKMYVEHGFLGKAIKAHLNDCKMLSKKPNFIHLIILVMESGDKNSLEKLILIYKKQNDFKEPLSVIPHLLSYTQCPEDALAAIKDSLHLFDPSKLINDTSFAYHGFNALHIAISRSSEDLHTQLYPLIKMLVESNLISVNATTKNPHVTDKTPLQIIAYDAALDSHARTTSIHFIIRCLVIAGCDIDLVTQHMNKYGPAVIGYIQELSAGVAVISSHNQGLEEILYRNSSDFFSNDPARIIASYAKITDFDDFIIGHEQEVEQSDSTSPCCTMC